MRLVSARQVILIYLAGASKNISRNDILALMYPRCRELVKSADIFWSHAPAYGAV